MICDAFWAGSSDYYAIFHDFSWFYMIFHDFPVKVFEKAIKSQLVVLAEAYRAEVKHKNSKKPKIPKNTPYIPTKSILGMFGGHMWS